jgi:hypothetical protein
VDNYNQHIYHSQFNKLDHHFNKHQLSAKREQLHERNGLSRRLGQWAAQRMAIAVA